ncbi:MAG TPA: Ser-Thr-rich GPI-anchored membrane family protein [Candidatus Syntrophosphaera sp.]|nr:Ser-Thr-rich GPI-anchored membrane family protein [Candidatus Syntrophosphaera sp.]
MKNAFCVLFLLLFAFLNVQILEGASSLPLLAHDNGQQTSDGIRNLQADLVGFFTSTSTTNLSPGDGFSVLYTISNIGDISAGASDTKFYFSNDQTFGDGDDIYSGIQPCTALPSGQSVNLSVNLIAPSYMTPGSWYLFFKADANTAVSEYNEDNNVTMAPPVFTIVQNTPQLTVIAPNGGESWQQNNAYVIQWTFSMLTGNVKIDLIRGTSSATVLAISASTNVDAGSYNWTIPTSLTPADNYKIRITSLSDLSVYDTSNNYFTINPPPSINVLSPNGGEAWLNGSTYAIAWSYLTLTGNVKIELLQGPGTTPLATIISSTPVNTGIFNWTIPYAIEPGANYRVKVTSLVNSSVSDISDNYFSIDTPPSIMVTAPNGGETWVMDSSYNITWTAVNLTGNVKIELTQGTGSTPVHTISSSTPAGTESYNWSIPNSLASATNYKIKISSLSVPTVNDLSDNYFSISSPPSITVAAPNGGETWLQGASYAISWTSVNLSGNVRIDLLQGTNTTPWATISASTPTSAGVYSWTIPFAIDPASNYKVKITSLVNGNVSDLSDNFFTINPAPAISVLMPNGGELWQRESTQYITWTYLSMTGNVKIELLQGTGSTPVYTISNSTAIATGNYEWNIPAAMVTADNYKVKITSLSNSTVFDTSDNYFSVVPAPSLNVTSPNGGEVWLRGSSHAITWSHTTIAGTLRIDLMQNNASVSVIGTESIALGSYSWMIPEDLPLGENYKIQITSISDPDIHDQSDANFSISTSGVTVLSPNGLEVWMSGESYDVLWTSQNLSGNVKVELCRGSDSTPIVMIHSSIAAAVGSYQWLVPPLQTGSDFRVKITSLVNPNIYDLSDAFFSISGVPNDDPTQVPARTHIVANYPNPFNPNTTIRYYLKQTNMIKIRIYDVKGRAVRCLYDGHQLSGYHSIGWDGLDESGHAMPSGVYWALLQDGKDSHVYRITMMK